MPSNHLIFCYSLLFLPPIYPSIKDFSSETALRIRLPKYWSFSSSISSSSEHPGLVSFSMDWLDLFVVQGTHQTLNTIIQKHQFVSAQQSLQANSHAYDYWKNHSLDWRDICGQVMSLLFNMLPKLFATFLPRSKPLLISWLQSPSAVTWEYRE